MAGRSKAGEQQAVKRLASPAAALFDGVFQGGAAVEILGASGSNPTSNWKVSGAVQRVYDKSVKGYVFCCEGGPLAKMQLPGTIAVPWPSPAVPRAADQRASHEAVCARALYI